MSDQKENIWILTFEYDGVIKLGGLGEVTANQSKNLSDAFNFTVFIPSHGQTERLTKQRSFQKISFISTGNVNLANLGLPETKGAYEISYYKFNFNGINIILLNGENDFSKKYLNDKSIYNPDTFNGKLLLYTLGVKSFIKNLISKEMKDLPKVVHLHDYHVVPPFITIKQEFIKNKLDVSSIITIHLLTRPRFELEFIKACGIDDTPITIRLEKGIKRMDINQIYQLCQEKSSNGEIQPPFMEKIGALISDLVITVSESYLKSSIIPKLGGDLIRFKSDFVWNGCDWDYYDIYENVINSFGKEIRDVLDISESSRISRKDLKKYLLTYKIGNLERSPFITSEKVLDTINEISDGNIFKKDGTITPFKDSGPLAIGTGRISRQKGFDTIFKAIPSIIEIIPNAKFLLLILPTEYSLNEIKEYAQYVKKYSSNLRIVFGIAPSIFHLAHISADVYLALSRWEPFGIIVLEAMASKLPVIATKVGGFQETIIDLREDPDNGTGVLLQEDNVSQFSSSVISLLKSAKISENTQLNTQKKLNIIEEIPDEKIKKLVKKDPQYFNRVRENCYIRVDNNFRWKKVSQKLKQLYFGLIELNKTKYNEID